MDVDVSGDQPRTTIERATPGGRRLANVFAKRGQRFLGCPSWSPDGRRLAFSNGNRTILITDRSGRVVRRVRVPALPGELDPAPGSPNPKRLQPLDLRVAFSPDGRELAYTPGGRTYVVRLRDGRRRQVCRCGDDLSWQARPR